MATISEIAKWLSAHDDFALMAHIRPDGDSLGSTLALKLALEQQGKRAVVVYPGAIPQEYDYLPGFDTLTDEKHLPFEPKSVVLVDVADVSRVGDAAAVYHAVEERCVIDHHEITDCKVPVHHIRPKAAAAGELIFELVREMGVELTKDIAVCLYTAISTDTGNFNFSNVTPECMRACADCVAAGVDVSELTRRVFRVKPARKVRLIAQALDTIEYLADGKLAVGYITRAMFEKAGAVRADSNNIVNFLIETEGVLAAILAEELDNGSTKFSFRSMPPIDVAALAREVGGGGHMRASGATLDMPLKEAMDTVMNVFLPAAEAL